MGEERSLSSADETRMSVSIAAHRIDAALA